MALKFKQASGSFWYLGSLNKTQPSFNIEINDNQIEKLKTIEKIYESKERKRSYQILALGWTENWLKVFGLILK